jgi:hypothetical protein
MTSGARPTPVWNLMERHSTPTKCECLNGTTRSERFEGNMTTLAARASESVDSCTLDGLTVISERVASQAYFGWGGEA